MASLLLAHPLFLAMSPTEQTAASPYFPLGILYLAGYVRHSSHDVAVFDGTFEAGYEAFDAALDRHLPDVVGISGLLPTRQATLALAERAERRGIPVIVGGPDPTVDPGPYLAHDAVDLVVHHEGEQTMVVVLDHVAAGTLDLERLADEPGLAFRRDGHIVVNPPRQPIEDLDSLPFPARDLIDMDRYLQTWDDNNGYSSMTVSTSRGCPYSCSWCAEAVHGQGFRQRSPQSVAAEVQALAQRYDISRLRFVDDVDGIERSWLERWACASEEIDAVIPFEALNDLDRQDLPLLEVRDSL